MCMFIKIHKHTSASLTWGNGHHYNYKIFYNLWDRSLFHVNVILHSILYSLYTKKVLNCPRIFLTTYQNKTNVLRNQCLCKTCQIFSTNVCIIKKRNGFFFNVTQISFWPFSTFYCPQTAVLYFNIMSLQHATLGELIFFGGKRDLWSKVDTLFVFISQFSR